MSRIARADRASMNGPNNAFGTEERSRFGQSPLAIMRRGQLDEVPEFVDPARPTVVIADKVLADRVGQLTAGLNPVDFVKVSGEPTQAFVKSVAQRLDSVGVANFVAVGGGSTLDVAKAVRSIRTFGGNLRIGYGELRRRADFVIPPDWFVAVPSLPGSGAESSRYFVLADESGRKQPGRGWHLQANVALLDPELCTSAPQAGLISGAFDAFVHGWETLITRGESNEYSRLLSLRTMDMALRGASGLVERGPLPEVMEDLLQASFLGGVVISSVRVGLLHTAGEALAAEFHVPHPQSLMLFAQAAKETYDPQYLEKPWIDRWLAGLEFWTQRWNEVPTETPALSAASLQNLKDAILADTTLIEKTHPGVLEPQVVEDFLERSVARNC